MSEEFLSRFDLRHRLRRWTALGRGAGRVGALLRCTVFPNAALLHYLALSQLLALGGPFRCAPGPCEWVPACKSVDNGRDQRNQKYGEVAHLGNDSRPQPLDLARY